MSILWCGGEDIDFPNGVVNFTSGYPNHYRSSYSRGQLFSGRLFYSDPFPGGEITDGWLTFRNHFPNTGIVSFYLCGLVADDGLTGYWVYFSARKCVLRKYESGWSTLQEESGTSLGLDGIGKIDMKVTNFGSSGNIKVWLNSSQLLIDYSGTLTLSGVTGLNRVGGLQYDSAPYCGMSEVIVADEDTRLMCLKTLVPNAAGDTNQWNNDYTYIDEATLNKEDGIYIDSSDKDFQCNLTGMPTGDYNVRLVKVNALGASLESNNLALQVGVKTNSDIDLSTQVNFDGSWQNFEIMYDENPITSSEWTPSEIEALQAMVRTKTAT